MPNRLPKDPVVLLTEIVQGVQEIKGNTADTKQAAEAAQEAAERTEELVKKPHPTSILTKLFNLMVVAVLGAGGYLAAEYKGKQDKINADTSSILADEAKRLGEIQGNPNITEACRNARAMDVRIGSNEAQLRVRGESTPEELDAIHDVLNASAKRTSEVCAQQ